ncbi:MAG: hypothetical protein HN948_05235 [Clostridia bacterium]|jgi:dihydrofolate synthase / folylpolyglutamate synthase|nr:hypothetical protein [Clostridia bacterium]MBT7122396.1 hypothetical protein [Clostridia bacterium]
MKYIHIAGTNGKGSVAEYISNIILASGASCGCYTSPHLFSPTERIRINGKNITEAMLGSLLKEVDSNNLAVNKTQFAKYTAAAYLWFSRKKIDYAVIETGLGGRLDPTNVIDAQIVVLTPISYDHTKILGNSIQEIAAEKCGIIKSNTSVVSAQQIDDAKAIIQSHCDKLNAPLSFISDVQITSNTLSGQRFLYNGNAYEITSIGEWQPQNAALAIACTQNIGISEKAITKGLLSTIVKRRTEYIQGEPPMLIDGAHNTSSISMLLKTIDRHFSNTNKVLLFACMDDKDYASMIDLIGSTFSHVVVVSADIARGADVHKLKKLFSKHSSCEIENDIPSGVKKAKTIARKQDALMVVCGSLYLAGSKFIQ